MGTRHASGAELLVLPAIADHADDTGGGAWPSVKALADTARTKGCGAYAAFRGDSRTPASFVSKLPSVLGGQTSTRSSCTGRAACLIAGA
ncbi:helix-turn-helix domain-containing protein [Planotetraspora thailandica]|uniref:helix-turn-helix domain-containing protein n=1 Tax=Planotetraspora thailandica TaxID=487172 RepID=UPI0035711B9D